MVEEEGPREGGADSQPEHQAGQFRDRCAASKPEGDEERTAGRKTHTKTRSVGGGVVWPVENKTRGSKTNRVPANSGDPDGQSSKMASVNSTARRTESSQTLRIMLRPTREARNST